MAKGLFKRILTGTRSLLNLGEGKGDLAVGLVDALIGPQAGAMAASGLAAFRRAAPDPLSVRVPRSVRRIPTQSIGPPAPVAHRIRTTFGAGSRQSRAGAVLHAIINTPPAPVRPTQPHTSPTQMVPIRAVPQAATSHALPQSTVAQTVVSPSQVVSPAASAQPLPAAPTPVGGVRRQFVLDPSATGATPPITSAGVVNMSLLTELGKLAQRIPQVLRNPAVQGAGGAAAGTAIGAGLVGLDAFGQPKKRRRMNYGNAKAARRAIRRIKGTRKLLQDIEKQLPRRTVRSRAPAGHRARLTHD